MDNVEIVNMDTYEFEFEEFTIKFEDNVWFAEFVDPEIESIILEDEKGCYFENEVQLLNCTLTKERFKEFKKIVSEA